jgi:oligopeptide/dipeptide ABC transporter ATP-binding protein
VSLATLAVLHPRGRKAWRPDARRQDRASFGPALAADRVPGSFRLAQSAASQHCSSRSGYVRTKWRTTRINFPADSASASALRALALGPRLIVCDEPVSALDVSIQAQVLNLMMDLQREFGLAYLFISHNLAVVEHISDNIAVMYLGRIVEYTNKHTLFTRALHPYTEQLLLAVPVPDPRVKRQKRMLQGDVPSPINPPSGCHFHTRCPYAVDRCRAEAPALREVKPGHWVACHLR